MKQKRSCSLPNFSVAVLTIFLGMACSQRNKQNSSDLYTYPHLRTSYDFAFGHQDSLTTQKFKEFGFSLSYPHAYQVNASTGYYEKLGFSLRDSVVAYLEVHGPFSFDWIMSDSDLTAETDPTILYAEQRSQLPTPPVVINGDRRYSRGRIDSSAQFTSDNGLRVIVIYQTYVTEIWAEPGPHLRATWEFIVSPFLWVDVSTPDRTVLLEISLANPNRGRANSNNFVVALVNSIARLR